MFVMLKNDGEMVIDDSTDGYDENWTLLGETDRGPEPYEVWDNNTLDWIIDPVKQAAYAQHQADNQEEEELKSLKLRRLAKRVIRRALLDMLTMQEAGGIITTQQKTQGENWVNNRYNPEDS